MYFKDAESDKLFSLIFKFELKFSFKIKHVMQIFNYRFYLISIPPKHPHFSCMY